MNFIIINILNITKTKLKLLIFSRKKIITLYPIILKISIDNLYY